MPTKSWYESKTVLATAIGIIVSVYEVFAKALPHAGLPPLDTGVFATLLSILSALGLYGRVSATTTIK